MRTLRQINQNYRVGVVGERMKKIKISERAAIILDGVFTGIYLVLAFWVDWRIGLAFLAYDLSCVFSDIKDDIKMRDKSARSLLQIIQELIREEVGKKNAERKTDD